MQPVVELKADVIVGFVGIALTLFFTYFPGVRAKFGALATESKSLVMLGLNLLGVAVVLVLIQLGVITTLEPVNWLTIAQLVFAVLTMNVASYTILPQPKDVQVAKASREI